MNTIYLIFLIFTITIFIIAVYYINYVKNINISLFKTKELQYDYELFKELSVKELEDLIYYYSKNHTYNKYIFKKF